VITLVCLLLAVDIGPVLPARSAPHLYEINLKVQKQLAVGDFALAKKTLNSWPSGELNYEIIGDLTPHYAGSDLEASSAIEAVSGGKVRFKQGPNPIVYFEVIESSPTGEPEPEWRSGKLYVKVPLRYGGWEANGPRVWVVRSFARGMGYAVGLGLNKRVRSFMGHMVYTPPGGPEPAGHEFDSTDRANLLQILAAKEQLERAVKHEQRIVPAEPKLKASPTLADAGEVTQGDVPKVKFELENVGNAPLFLYIETTCVCLVADKISKLEPGEKFTMEAGIATANLFGVIEKEILFYTNDPTTPISEVLVRTTSMPEYRVWPEGSPQVTLRDEGTTSYDLFFYSTGKNLVRLIAAQVGTNDVTAEILPWEGEINDPLLGPEPTTRKGSKIQLTFGPNYPVGLSWVRVVLVTDSKDAPYQNITLQAKKGVIAEPKGFWFAMKAGEKAERTFSIYHATRAFRITEIQPEGGPFKVEIQPDGEGGNRYRVTVTCDHPAAGKIDGRIRIKTSLSDNSEIIVTVGGEVR
jgi:hypothetical protein